MLFQSVSLLSGFVALSEMSQKKKKKTHIQKQTVRETKICVKE